GHAIGLRHTNWQGLETAAPFGANQIPGTPQTDANSVMNSGTGLREWAGFSTYDKLAGFWLYPRPDANVQISYPNNQPYFAWNALPDSPSYQIVIEEVGYWIDSQREYWDIFSSYRTPWSSATTA